MHQGTEEEETLGKWNKQEEAGLGSEPEEEWGVVEEKRDIRGRTGGEGQGREEGGSGGCWELRRRRPAAGEEEAQEHF